MDPTDTTDHEQLVAMCTANTIAISLVLSFLPPQARKSIAEAGTCFAETAQASLLSDAVIAATAAHLAALAGTAPKP